MNTINMMSTADKVKGQGVGSAYLETVALVKSGLSNEFEVKVNGSVKCDITHYHTIDFKHYIQTFFNKKTIHLGYVHFLPETIDGSIKLPKMIRKIFDKYMISFYKRMDYLVTVNPYFISKLIDLGIEPKKISAIPNYVSKDMFFPLNQELIKLHRKEYGISEDDFVVLGVGQIQTRKGVLDFIDLANKNPNKQFLWAGGFSFGGITDGYKELKEIVENPPGNVTFLGIINRSEMNKIYNISNVLFMPSYNELFPMAILEAMNVGLPLLLRKLEIYENILDSFYLYGTCNNEFNYELNQLAYNHQYYLSAREHSHNGSILYSKENVLKQWENLYKNLLDERYVI